MDGFYDKYKLGYEISHGHWSVRGIIIIIIIIIQNSKCRICEQFEEAVEHIISAYPVLAKEQYTDTWLECVLN